MEQVKTQHFRLIDGLSLPYKRGVIDKIDWRARLIGIRGARGVGKTTLMLQHIKECFGAQPEKALYVSMDHLYFTRHTLVDLAEQFRREGGRSLFLDEVHKYSGWSREVKIIYDTMPDMQVVFTGSSLLNILNAEADLSRRCASYDMQGLSFREYLLFSQGVELPMFSLDDVLHHGLEASRAVVALCRPLEFFHKYLQTGYYPFFQEQGIDYLSQLQKVVNMILEIELPQLRGVDVANVRKLRSLLGVLSSGIPFTVDISKMAVMSALNRNTILSYLDYLEGARVINMLYCDSVSMKRMQKPEKIYMENTNLLHALTLDKVEAGTERETFFVNQLSYGHGLEYGKQADFVVDRNYLVEVGGQSKDGKQIAGREEAYIASDNIEYAMGNKIPLWLFGCMY